MADDQVASTSVARGYSVAAIIAAFAGVASLFLTGSPLLATVVSLAAIATSLYARKQLKQSPGLRGFGISLAGFLAALWVLITTGVPYIYFTALVALN